MKRILLVFVVLVVSAIVVPVTPAAAAPWGCQFSTGHLKWKAAITDTNAYLNPAQHAALAWHVATDSDITFTQVQAGANIAVADGRFGNTGFVSVLRNNLGDPPFVTCSDGRWTRGLVAWWNRFYTDAYSGAKKKAIMVSELGHALGLGDDQSSRCDTIMWNPPNVMYDACGIHTPQGRDIAWVNQMY